MLIGFNYETLLSPSINCGSYSLSSAPLHFKTNNKSQERKQEGEGEGPNSDNYKGPGDDLTVVKKTAFELAECRPQSVECIS